MEGHQKKIEGKEESEDAPRPQTPEQMDVSEPGPSAPRSDKKKDSQTPESEQPDSEGVGGCRRKSSTSKDDTKDGTSRRKSWFKQIKEHFIREPASKDEGELSTAELRDIITRLYHESSQMEREIEEKSPLIQMARKERDHAKSNVRRSWSYQEFHRSITKFLIRYESRLRVTRTDISIQTSEEGQPDISIQTSEDGVDEMFRRDSALVPIPERDAERDAESPAIKVPRSPPPSYSEEPQSSMAEHRQSLERTADGILLQYYHADRLLRETKETKTKETKTEKNENENVAGPSEPVKDEKPKDKTKKSFKGKIRKVFKSSVDLAKKIHQMTKLAMLMMKSEVMHIENPKPLEGSKLMVELPPKISTPTKDDNMESQSQDEDNEESLLDTFDFGLISPMDKGPQYSYSKLSKTSDSAQSASSDPKDDSSGSGASIRHFIDPPSMATSSTSLPVLGLDTNMEEKLLQESNSKESGSPGAVSSRPLRSLKPGLATSPRSKQFCKISSRQPSLDSDDSKLSLSSKGEITDPDAEADDSSSSGQERILAITKSLKLDSEPPAADSGGSSRRSRDDDDKSEEKPPKRRNAP